MQAARSATSPPTPRSRPRPAAGAAHASSARALARQRPRRPRPRLVARAGLRLPRSPPWTPPHQPRDHLPLNPGPDRPPHRLHLRHYLPRAKSKRGRRGRRGGSPALHIQDRVPKAKRPAAAQDRSTQGHWEAGLILFARYGQAILALHERASRILLAVQTPGKAASPVAKAIAELLAPLPP